MPETLHRPRPELENAREWAAHAEGFDGPPLTHQVCYTCADDPLEDSHEQLTDDRVLMECFDAYHLGHDTDALEVGR